MKDTKANVIDLFKIEKGDVSQKANYQTNKNL